MRGKGEGSIFRVPADRTLPLKYWQAYIELPNPTGLAKDRRRKTIRSRDKAVLLTRLAEAKEDLRRSGDLATSSPTVEQWLEYWLDHIAINDVTPGTLAGYRSMVKTHISPGLGAKTKLEKLNAASIRRMHDRMTGLGLSSTYALNAHRILSSALTAAMREGKIPRNPTQLVKAPRKAAVKLDVLTPEESLQMLSVCAGRADGTRRATSLLTGARRGEVIGLELDRVTDVLDLSWQLRRLPWEHGCGGHCGMVKGGYCPDRFLRTRSDFEYRRIEGGLYWTRPKSLAGWRIIPLVDPLRTLLERHIATLEPGPHGLVFTRDAGRPIDPDQDTAEWGNLMRSVFGEDRSVRLHDLRHTAVDLLYLAGVPEDIIQEIVGHSTRSMTRGYKTKGNQDRMRGAMMQLTAYLEQ